MKRPAGKTGILFFLLFLPFLAAAQKPPVLNAKSRSKLVGDISRELLDNYVFPDTAVKMSNRLMTRLKEGAYDKITDPVAFSDALTIDLYSVYQDNHLLVRYAPQEAQAPAPVVPAVDADPFLAIKQANFGLRKAEILNGNIGYIAIDRFWADSVHGAKTVRAMFQFVSHARALIIDVRNCGGGSQETVRMICSYFFGQPTHLNDMFDRPAGTTTAYWTKPDSAFVQLLQMPLYILANSKTFSAGEEFCYDLQCLKRATIVGETTGGGAHGTYSQPLDGGFVLSLPYSTAVNPVTHTSWEKTGVKPDVEVDPAKALETAEMIIFERVMADTKDPQELFRLKWELDLLRAANHPLVLDAATLKNYAGVYGERTFTFENGKLYYQRTGRPKFELEAMSPTMMKGVGNTYFKIEFVTDAGGKTEKVLVYYQDNRVETSVRTD